jgi:hypothetical protein
MTTRAIDRIVLAQRFWARVQKADGEACWLWRGVLDEKRYGRLCVAGKMPRAHRLSYELNVGPIPDGLFVCHHCDNPSCVRPDHLFVGTVTDNNRDMGRKGRAKWTRHPELTRGEQNPHAKLTNAQVLAIRELVAAGRNQKLVAAEFGVSPMTVSHIHNRRRWSHLP